MKVQRVMDMVGIKSVEQIVDDYLSRIELVEHVFFSKADMRRAFIAGWEHALVAMSDVWDHGFQAGKMKAAMDEVGVEDEQNT